MQGLIDNKSIETVNLLENNLDEETTSLLQPFISSDSTPLKRLFLSHNAVSNETFQSIVEALQHRENIEEIHFSNCGLREGAFNPHDGSFNSLTRLNLSENNLTDTDCVPIAKLLARKNSSLTHLHMDTNQLTDAGVEAIVYALQSNTSLTSLHLSGNKKVTESSESAFLRLICDVSSVSGTCSSNHTLKSLDLSGWWGGKILDDAIACNHRYEPRLSMREKVLSFQLRPEGRRKMSERQQIQDFHLRPYAEIEAHLLPNTLSIIAKEMMARRELYYDDDFNDMYDEVTMFTLTDLYEPLVGNIARIIPLVNVEVAQREQRIDSLTSKEVDIQAQIATHVHQIAALELALKRMQTDLKDIRGERDRLEAEARVESTS